MIISVATPALTHAGSDPALGTPQIAGLHHRSVAADENEGTGAVCR